LGAGRQTGSGLAVSTERSDEFAPVWSPDAHRLFYGADRAGFYDIFSRPSNGGAEEATLKTNWDKWVYEVVSDGAGLLFGGSPAGHTEDIWIQPLTGDRQLKPVVETQGFIENGARLSPDGRWLAFSSNEPGRQEILIQAFPSGPKRPVSSSGGSMPVWSRDGKELYYVSADDKLTAVAVLPGPSGLGFGPPQPLFDLDPALLSAFDPRVYDVGPDGRFLIVRGVGSDSAHPIVLDLHWTARLKLEPKN
jgi:Tol biopolymer transport system component